MDSADRHIEESSDFFPGLERLPLRTRGLHLVGFHLHAAAQCHPAKLAIDRGIVLHADARLQVLGTPYLCRIFHQDLNDFESSPSIFSILLSCLASSRPCR